MKNKKFFRKSLKVFSLLILLVIVSFVSYKRFFNQDIINNDPDSRLVLSTIDNREYGMPYINPEWIEYNRLSEEERNNVSIIPSKYIYDYKPVTNLYGTYSSLPSQFNLRDEYATPIYDQGTDGLCWAYSSATMMESNLKVTKGITTRFSPNHMSFVTASTSYFNENYNVYSENRRINDGLAAKYYFSFNRVLLAAGVMPATNPLEDPFEDNFDISRKYNYDDIFNVNNFNYTVKNTVNFPEYQNTDDYKNMIKSFIKKYGGVKVFMSWGRKDIGYNEEYALHYDYDEYGSGHAVVLIGWDDNYTYKDHKGAWIFQNSYGKTEGDKVFYISYDMPSKGMRELTGIINMEERDWDNVYNYSNYPLIEYNGFKIKQEIGVNVSSVYENSTIPTSNPMALTGTMQLTYNKDKAKSEKIKSINFITASQNGKYYVYLSPTGDKHNYLYLGVVETTMPGIQTVEIKDNVVLNSDTFTVKIISNDGMFYQYANVFTTILEENDSVEEAHTNVTMLSKNNAGNYSYKLTTFLPDEYVNGEFLYYTVESKYNDMYHNLYSGNYYPYNGKSEVLIYVPYNTPIGSPITVTIKDKTHKLVDKFTFNYEVDAYNGDMPGNGTEDDPYMVSTVKQLRLISEIPSAYYKLANDIDLSLATIDEQEDINYLGWVSLDPFGGVLDGDGHTIKNIETKAESTSYHGIFRELNGATIKNLVIENFKSSGNESDIAIDGALANSVNNTKINNVVVSCDLNSKVKNFIGLASNLQVDGLSIYANVSGDSYVHSFIAVDNEHNYIKNLSVISNKVLKIPGVFQLRDSYFINIDKTDSTPSYYFKDIEQIFNVYLYTNQESQNDEIHTFSNISDFSSQSLENISFNENMWTKVSENSLPVLKAHNTLGVSEISGDSEYSLNIGEKKIISYSVLTPDAFYKNVEFSIDDTDIAYVENGYVIGRNDGTTTLHIKSTDGTNVEFSVTINVNNNVLYYFDYGDRKEVITLEKGSRYVLPTESGNDRLLVGWLDHGINKYEPGEELPVGSSRDFVAVYSDDLLANSNYIYDNEKKIINNLCMIDVDSFIDGLKVPENYNVKIFNGDEELTSGNIPTGSVTRIYKNDNLVGEYTNSILGDIYKDGEIDVRDAGMLVQYLVGIRELDDAQLRASDFSRDSQIRLNDVQLIKRYLVHDFDYYERMCPNEG